MNKNQNMQVARRRNPRSRVPHPLKSADPPRMLPKPFVPFQVSFDTAVVTLGQLRSKINSTVLGITLDASLLSFEARLGAIGVWELSGGDVTLTVIDPITVFTDSLTAIENNALFTSTDFAARNKWAHLYYRYKPEVHSRSIRLDDAPAGTQKLLTVSTTAAAPKIHIQIFGSWRSVQTIV